MPYVLLACLDDHRGEVGSLERSAAHEGAVNVGLGDELGNVAGLSGATVQDTDAVGELLTEHLLEGLTDSAADLLSVLGGSGLAGADGPDGLVGDNDLLGASDLETLETSLNLVHDVLDIGAGLADLKGLAAAEDGNKTGGNEGLGLLVLILVGLVEVITTLSDR